MTFAEVADIYVNWVEPIGKFLIFGVVAVTILHFVILARHAKKKEELISSLFKAIWGTVAGIFKYIGLALWWLLRMIYRIFHVLFATIRDFFTSKI